MTTRGRVLIVDDNDDHYRVLRRYFRKEGFSADKQAKGELSARAALAAAQAERQWFDLVFIDLNLSAGGESSDGVQVYQSLVIDYPHEEYVIYSSQDVDRFRQQLNRLLFRDVLFVLLDELLTQENLSLQLSRIVRAIDKRKIFLVSGRDVGKNIAMERLLRDGFGLDVISWEDARERVTARSDVNWEIALRGIEMSHATVVLFTDEERVALEQSMQQPGDPEHGGLQRRQARPNVYIEAGYAYGLRPKRTIFVEWPRAGAVITAPSDFAGVHVVRFDGSVSTRATLKRRLEAARCLIETDDVDWQSLSMDAQL